MSIYAFRVCCSYGILNSDKIVTQMTNAKSPRFYSLSSSDFVVVSLLTSPRAMHNTRKNVSHVHLTIYVILSLSLPPSLPPSPFRMLTYLLGRCFCLFDSLDWVFGQSCKLNIYCDQQISIYAIPQSYNRVVSFRFALLCFWCAFQFCLWNINISKLN